MAAAPAPYAAGHADLHLLGPGGRGALAPHRIGDLARHHHPAVSHGQRLRAPRGHVAPALRCRQSGVAPAPRSARPHDAQQTPTRSMAWIPPGYRGRPSSDTGAEDAAVTIVEIERRQPTERRHRTCIDTQQSTHRPDTASSRSSPSACPRWWSDRRTLRRALRRRHVEDTAGVDGRSVGADLAHRTDDEARAPGGEQIEEFARRAQKRRTARSDRARLGRGREPLLSRLGPGDRQKGRRRRVRSRNDPVACVGHRGRHHVASDQHPVPDHERQPPCRGRVRPLANDMMSGLDEIGVVGRPCCRRPSPPVRVRRTATRPRRL